jgi:hypothetical protein
MRLIDAEGLKRAVREKFPALPDRCEINELVNAAPTVDAIPTDILHTRCHPSAEQAFQRKMFGCLMIVPVNYKAEQK